MQVKTATQKKWAAILGGYRCSRQGAGIGQSPSIEMTSASGIECNFFRLNDRIYTDRSRRNRAHDIIPKSDDRR